MPAAEAGLQRGTLVMQPTERVREALRGAWRRQPRGGYCARRADSVPAEADHRQGRDASRRNGDCLPRCSLVEEGRSRRLITRCRIARDVPKFAADQKISEEQPLQIGLEQKAREFAEKGTEFYVP